MSDHQEEDKRSVGGKIRKARKDRHMSQAELTERLGGDPEKTSNISRVENGTDHLRIGPLFAIADILEVSIVALLPDRLTKGSDLILSDYLSLNPGHREAVRQLIRNLKAVENKK